MKASASIELLWQMAAQEAIAGEFAEIEPEHFFAAMLKFAELPIQELGNLAAGARVPEELATEVEKVRQELQSRAIDSTRVRRELRIRLGKGGSPFDGAQKHRSQTCREVFDAAARLADDSGSEALAAEHLLAALLTSPTEAIRAVLGEALAPKAIKRSETPLLAKYGKDLVQLAADGKLPAFSERKAESKNLLAILADPRRLCVLLVTDGDETARSAVAAAAQAMASPDAPAGLKGRRIVDVTGGLPAMDLPALSFWWNNMFCEAAGANDVVLFVPPILGPFSPWQGDFWPELLKKSVCGGSLQFICRVSPTAYQRWIKRDVDWKRHAQVMWIEEQGSGEIPLEL